LSEQAEVEAKQDARAAKSSFGNSQKRNGTILPSYSANYDGFARGDSPGKSHAQKTGGSFLPTNLNLNMKRGDNSSGACEWDRLMKEREDLISTGAYTPDDPLI